MNVLSASNSRLLTRTEYHVMASFGVVANVYHARVSRVQREALESLFLPIRERQFALDGTIYSTLHSGC